MGFLNKEYDIIKDSVNVGDIIYCSLYGLPVKIIEIRIPFQDAINHTQGSNPLKGHEIVTWDDISNRNGDGNYSIRFNKDNIKRDVLFNTTCFRKMEATDGILE